MLRFRCVFSDCSYFEVWNESNLCVVCVNCTCSFSKCKWREWNVAQHSLFNAVDGVELSRLFVSAYVISHCVECLSASIIPLLLLPNESQDAWESIELHRKPKMKQKFILCWLCHTKRNDEIYFHFCPCYHLLVHRLLPNETKIKNWNKLFSRTSCSVLNLFKRNIKIEFGETLLFILRPEQKTKNKQNSYEQAVVCVLP